MAERLDVTSCNCTVHDLYYRRSLRAGVYHPPLHSNLVISGPITDYPRHATVHELVAARAARTPDAIAAIDDDGTLTYGELDRRSNQLAALLVARGLPREAFVGVMLDRSVEVLVALCGILKAGGAYLPLHDDLPFKRMRYMLRDAGARVLISQRRHMRWLNKLQWECPALDVLLCIDSDDARREPEEIGEMMKEDMWRYIRRDMHDDVSGGGFRSSYSGELLGRDVIDSFADNVLAKLDPYLGPSTRVLEIGCASGISLLRIAPRVGSYLGTDMSQDILEWTRSQVDARGITNVRLERMAAHELDRIGDERFDVVILNSVVQCFSGHNYLRDVMRRAAALCGDRGVIFLGNVWDLALLDAFEDSLAEFARAHAGQGYRTKTDRSEDLFLSRAFFDDLRQDVPAIAGVECAPMLGSVTSELSEYGYDALLHVGPSGPAAEDATPPASRHKHQLDRRHLDAQPETAIAERAGPESLAYLMYTSGTSGVPKGVMVEHRAIIRLVVATNYVDLGPTDRTLQAGSLGFDASTFEIWGALCNGGAVCMPRKEVLLDAAELRQLIERHGITTTFLTASLFNLLVTADPCTLRGMRTVLVGGEKVSRTHFELVRRSLPDVALVNGYGPTENTTFTATYRYDGSGEGDVPIGGPIANTTVMILDEGLMPVSPGAEGELCAGGDGLARGYLNDQELTDRKFVPHPIEPRQRLYRTGDRARVRADGNIEYLGRMDDQVKIRGYRIEPAEIERRILQHGEVTAAVVVARQLGAGHADLVAYIVGSAQIDLDPLRAHLRTALPDYMVPAHFVRLDRLPLNPNGKIDRAALPDPDGGAAPDRSMELQTDLERSLAGIWEEVLGQRGIGATDDFFDLGGDSLKITKLAMLIRKRLKREVPLTIVFKVSTVRGLADYLGAPEPDGRS